MTLGKLILTALILGPFGYGLGWLLGYLWFGTSSLSGVIGAGAFTLGGAVSSASTSDLPRKPAEEEIGLDENYTLGGLRLNRYGDDD
jgi:hypothetical protein